MDTVTMFGKTYNAIGTSTGNLLLRTRGDIKILYGNTFIDLIKNGKIGSASSVNIPSGIITLYNGTEAPDGWSICDGTNDTPDLSAQFMNNGTIVYIIKQ